MKAIIVLLWIFWVSLDTQVLATDSPDWLNLAVLAQKENRHQQAIELYTSALEADAGNVKYLRLRAESYQYLGQLEQAEADLQLGLKLAPQDSALLEGLGWLRLFQKDFVGAEVALRQSLALSQDNFWARLNLAHALLLQNKEQQALSLYCQLGRAEPGKRLGKLLAKDFARLRARGIAHAGFERMLRLFDSRCETPSLPTVCGVKH